MPAVAEIPIQGVTAATYWAHHDPYPQLAEYLDLLTPHRKWAIEAVQSFGQIETVLELGCHCGPLLHRLRQVGVLATGIDINADAVALAGRQGLAAIVGTLPGALVPFGDRCADLVVSSYCLSYLSPYDLVLALAHALRIARRGVVVVEPMAGHGVPPLRWLRRACPEWRHDYFHAFDCAVRYVPSDVELTRMAKGPSVDGINGVVIARVHGDHQ